MAWDPAQYLRFADHRLRPAIDLLARVSHERPGAVVDLGCGPGNVTRLLRNRWPGAQVTGVDSSSEMLERAAREAPEIEWVHADVAEWRPPRPVDVLFSNAALHWLKHHDRLIPQLFGYVAPGGAFAVQMPRMFDAPSHVAIIETVRGGPWRTRLEPLLLVSPVAEPHVYYDLLASLGAAVDLWEAEYTHALTGDDPVLEWVKGTALRPLLAALDEAERAEFEERCAALLRSAYPRRADGTTLLPYRRLFFVATRA